MVERSEFELPVPLSKLSDNSLMLSFAKDVEGQLAEHDKR